MFTSTKLKQVVGIDRAGSFSAAAKSQHISQSTLTKAVADVEQDLGFPIFFRTARGVVATPEGREFLSRAERIVADFDMLIEDARNQKTDGDMLLRIGVSPASQEGFYNRAIANLLKKRPELCVNMAGMPVERGIRMLKRGDLDLLLAPIDEVHHEAEFTTELISRVPVRMFGRKGHPIFEKENIQAEDLRDYKIISPDPYGDYSKRVIEILNDGDVDPRKRMHIIENFAVVSEAVATTDLIGMVSVNYAETKTFKQKFQIIDVDIFAPLEIGAARLTRWLPSRAVRACLSVLQNRPIEQES